MDKDFEELEKSIYWYYAHECPELIVSSVLKYVKKKVDEADFEGYKRGWEEGYSGCEFNRSSE